MIHERALRGCTGDYDVCIIGSGPAGITVANELTRLRADLRVCVLESGGLETAPFSDMLRNLDSSGIAVKPYSRERVLGGASSTWAGLSSVFDEIDFEARPWVRFSGWPICRADLIPFYRRAAEHYRFPELSLFDTGRWKDVLDAGDFVPQWNQLEGKVFLAAQEPQRFGQEYQHIFHSDCCDLYLDATVVRLEGDANSGQASAAVVKCSDGSECSVRARCFVLASGGIENARLLLLSTYSCPGGLGNERDQVGRYLMNHPKENYGTIIPKRSLRELPAFFGFMYRGYSGSIGLRLSDSAQRAQGLLNSYLRLRPVFDWSGAPGVEAAIHYVKRSKYLVKGFARLKRGRVVALRDYAETGDDSDLQNGRKRFAEHVRMVGMIWRDRSSVWHYLINRLADHRKAPVRTIRIRNFLEMEPEPSNRVTLGSRRDVFGNPLPQVDHDLTVLDRRTAQGLHDTLREEIRRGGWGELVSDLSHDMQPWPVNLDASHHMGTTRMGDDPATSVIDANCRIHTSPNVFVAGASVFPTSGNTNPTFTIVALAIRLAEHLAHGLDGAQAAPGAAGSGLSAAE